MRKSSLPAIISRTDKAIAARNPVRSMTLTVTVQKKNHAPRSKVRGHSHIAELRNHLAGFNRDANGTKGLNRWIGLRKEM